MGSHARALFFCISTLGVACGGQVLGKDAGPNADGGEPSDSSPKSDALPPVDSGVCQGSGNTCVLCADDKWHCPNGTFAQCPAGAAPGVACSPLKDGSCLTCSGGVGAQLDCLINDNQWNTSPDHPACSQ